MRTQCIIPFREATPFSSTNFYRQSEKDS
jgi:hypothetical protein